MDYGKIDDIPFASAYMSASKDEFYVDFKAWEEANKILEDAQKAIDTYTDSYYDLFSDAVPSHQEKLIEIGKGKYGKSRDDFVAMCPAEMYCDYMEWLCEVTGCVAMWNRFVVGKPNRFQMNKINELIDAGIVYSCVLNILNGGDSYV